MHIPGIACIALAVLGTGCAPTEHAHAPPKSPAAVPKSPTAARRWDREAIALADVALDPSASLRERQMAEHRLAVSFYELGLRTASAVVVGDISIHPKHAAFRESIATSLRLANAFPDIAELGALLAKYPEELRADRFEALPERERWRARYLIGRHAYENRRYAEAIGHLEQAKGQELARAQILIALCHVQLKKSVPAVAALVDAKKASRDGRLAELAVLLEARTFFSAALKYQADRRVLVVDREKMRHAIALWSTLDDSEAFATDARWERAWGHFSMGVLPAALAALDSALATPGAYLPEAELLRAHVRWAMGEKDAARQAYRQFLERHESIRNALRALSLPRDDGAFFELLERAEERAQSLPAPARAAFIRTLRTPELLRRLDFLRSIDRERRAFDGMPAALRSSTAGEWARRAITGARISAVQMTAEIVRGRLVATIAELDELLLASEQALRLSGRVKSSR